MKKAELIGHMRYCAEHGYCSCCARLNTPKGGSSDCYSELLLLAADEIEKHRWIPVAERLPECGERVIVCRGDKKVEQGVYLGVNGWWKVYGTNTKRVTHWKPMSDAPEE